MSNLWYEKYRPKTIDDYVFQSAAVQEMVESFKREKEIPNLLLSGVQGTGKSTLGALLDRHARRA